MIKRSLIITSLLLVSTSLVAQDNAWYTGVSYGKVTVDTGINSLTGTTSLDEKDTSFKGNKGDTIKGTGNFK